MGNTPDRFIADLLAGKVEDSLDGARLRLEALYNGTIPALAGVVGWPLEHTLSPALHNYWCARYKVPGAYLKIPVPPTQFVYAIDVLQKLGFRGVNVTVPHKERAFQLATKETEIATCCGSVNTLVFKSHHGVLGDSTDGAGFCQNVVAHGGQLNGSALVLGAGGASRAICAALLARGCDVYVTNRTPARAAALCAAIPGLRSVEWEGWASTLHRFTILINTTVLGMTGEAAYDWGQALINASDALTVCDIVYVPLQTPLLCAARARGMRTIDGLGMLIEQARVGFKAWFGIDPAADRATRAFLLDSLT